MSIVMMMMIDCEVLMYIDQISNEAVYLSLCYKIVISLRAERRSFLRLFTWPLFANTIISV